MVMVRVMVRVRVRVQVRATSLFILESYRVSSLVFNERVEFCLIINVTLTLIGGILRDEICFRVRVRVRVRVRPRSAVTSTGCSVYVPIGAKGSKIDLGSLLVLDLNAGFYQRQANCYLVA